MTDEPKIIVDDDWKNQVELEKVELAKEQATPSSQSDTQVPEMPPASFGILVSTLSTQALAGLGFLSDPATGAPNINREMAKHFIDTLAVLEEKTQGNLDDDEQSLLTETLHQLRMAFVASENQVKPESGKKTPSIELP